MLDFAGGLKKKIIANLQKSVGLPQLTLFLSCFFVHVMLFVPYLSLSLTCHTHHLSLSLFLALYLSFSLSISLSRSLSLFIAPFLSPSLSISLFLSLYFSLSLSADLWTFLPLLNLYFVNLHTIILYLVPLGRTLLKYFQTFF